MLRKLLAVKRLPAAPRRLVTLVNRAKGRNFLGPQISRRHHTVPRFYLDGFASDRRIGTVRLPGKTRFVQSTLNASAHTDFYSIPNAVGGPDVVERTLARLEGDTARVFERLKDSEWPLDRVSRETVATFLAVQFLRGPNRRRQIEQMMRLLLQVRIGIGRRAGFEEWAMQELGLSDPSR